MASAACVACQGFVRKSKFDKTCRTCGLESYEHPPVKISIEGREISDWDNVEPAFQRLVDHVWERLQKKCIHNLKSVIKAWKFKENMDKAEHENLCSQFLEDAPKKKNHVGCCFRMIKEHNAMQTIIDTKLAKERSAVDDMQISSPKGFHQYNFLMNSWLDCKADMLEYDKKIKTGCGRTDFVDPDFKRAAAASRTFEDKKKATVCPVCKKNFGMVMNKRRHCRHCLRVVCGKCAKLRAGTLGGPMVRLCTECLPF